MIAIVLAASTLLVPPAPRAVPAVVLIPGAGASDRDGTVGPNKPLADIALGLAERGIASIRGDDPAKAFRELTGARGVDARRIFLVGHAEGASIAPRVAEGTGSARGLVLLAYPMRPIDERMLDQVAYGAKLLGLDASSVADQTELLGGRFAEIRDRPGNDGPALLGRPAAYWRDLLSIDPVRSIAATGLPVLVLHADKDFEVRKDLDYDALRAAVGTAGGRVAYRSFPGLNHLFIEVEGVSSGAEYASPGHVHDDVIAAIADWVLSR